MSRFLQGQDSDSFAWVYPNRTNSMMRKMRRIVWGCTLNISIFAALGGAVYYVTYSKQAQEVKELVKNEVKQILPMFREVVNWLSSFRSL